MNARAKAAEVLPQTIEFKLDGNLINAYEGETILKAAKRHGVDIPHLCFKDVTGQKATAALVWLRLKVSAF